MIDLFLNKNTFTYRDRVPPSINNVYAKIKMYLNSVIDYYHRSNTIVNNENVLIQLLNSLDVDYRWSDIVIINYVRNNTQGLIKPLMLSSSITINTIADNMSIISGAKEIIYTVDYTNLTNYRNINASNWKTQEPLKFRNHDIRDLYFNHPTRMTLDKDIVIYELDILKLILMYKYYCLEREETEQYISRLEFIGRYVLTNSIHSMADIVMLNNYLDKGDIYTRPRQFVSTVLVPINTIRLRNDVISKSLINTSDIFIVELLRNIKLLDDRDSYDLLSIEKFYETSRSKIYLTLTLLDFIDNIFNHIDPSSKGNSMYTTKLAYYLRVLSGVHINTGDMIVDMKCRDIIQSLRSKL